MNLLTTAQVAKRLGVSQRRVQALISAGRLPVQRITDRMFLIDPKHLAKVRDRKPGRPKKSV